MSGISIFYYFLNLEIRDIGSLITPDFITKLIEKYKLQELAFLKGNNNLQKLIQALIRELQLTLKKEEWNNIGEMVVFLNCGVPITEHLTGKEITKELLAEAFMKYKINEKCALLKYMDKDKLSLDYVSHPIICCKKILHDLYVSLEKYVPKEVQNIEEEIKEIKENRWNDVKEILDNTYFSDSFLECVTNYAIKEIIIQSRKKYVESMINYIKESDLKCNPAKQYEDIYAYAYKNCFENYNFVNIFKYFTNFDMFVDELIDAFIEIKIADKENLLLETIDNTYNDTLEKIKKFFQDNPVEKIKVNDFKDFLYRECRFQYKLPNCDASILFAQVLPKIKEKFGRL